MTLSKRAKGSLQPTSTPWRRGRRGIAALAGVLFLLWLAVATAGAHPGAGGVFRSDDRGRTWREISGLLPGKAVTAIALHPDGERIYAGTDVGLFSGVEGVEWDPPKTGLPVAPVLALEWYRGRLYAGTAAGLYASDDGERWTPERGATGTLPVFSLRTIDDSFWVGALGQVARLRPSGWESLSPPGELGAVYALEPTPAGPALVGSATGLWRWDGRSWSRVAADLVAQPVWGLLAGPGGHMEAFSKGERAHLASADAGLTWWVEVTSAPRVAAIHRGIPGFADDPSPIVASDLGLYRREASEWRPLHDKLLGQFEVGVVLADPHGPGRLYAGAAATPYSKLFEAVAAAAPVSRQSESQPSALWFLASAFALGALHTLEPGHGKTVVGLFAASRARLRDVVAVGLSAAAAHTGSVLLLGLLATVASGLVATSTVERVLGVIGGLVVVVIGFTMLRDDGHHAHSHAVLPDHAAAGATLHDLAREHLHDHDHYHTHHAHLPCQEQSHVTAATRRHRPDHSLRLPHRDTPAVTVAEPAAPPSAREALAVESSGGGTGPAWLLGAVAGIVPCPAALGALVAAVAAGNAVYGLGVAAAFSLGVASVMLAWAALATVAGTWIRGRSGFLAGLERPLRLLGAVVVLGLGGWTLVRAIVGP
ncbi:MAG: sulfite exporter TauE/SafE family protein [Chloroflexi bacterium]|nr:sulfite exporter TauE/SafE family protein [Chloroflexota bacterium]